MLSYDLSAFLFMKKNHIAPGLKKETLRREHAPVFYPVSLICQSFISEHWSFYYLQRSHPFYSTFFMLISPFLSALALLPAVHAQLSGHVGSLTKTATKRATKSAV